MKPKAGHNKHGKGCVYNGRREERYIINKTSRNKTKVSKQEIERAEK